MRIRGEEEFAEDQDLGEPEVKIDSPYPRLHALNLDASFAAPEWSAGLEGRWKWTVPTVLTMLGVYVSFMIYLSRIGASFENLAIGAIGAVFVAFACIWIMFRAPRRTPIPKNVVWLSIDQDSNHELAAGLRDLGFKKFKIDVYSEGPASTRTLFSAISSKGCWDQLTPRQRLALAALACSSHTWGLAAKVVPLFCTALAVLYMINESKPSAPFYGLACLAAYVLVLPTVFLLEQRRFHLKLADAGLQNDLKTGQQVISTLGGLAQELRRERAKKS
jgi:hypothetical protein